MGVTILYLMGWFTGLLKPYMASAVTGLEADYQLHQIRILARIHHDHYRYRRLELRLACRGDIHDHGMDPSVFFSQRCRQAMADDARG